MHQGNVTPIKHSSKACNTQRASAGGILFTRRSGHVAYIEYGWPFAMEYLPGIQGKPEQIDIRLGDSYITIAGKNLWPLFEDMRARKCDAVKESERDQGALGVLYVEAITIRLCF